MSIPLMLNHTISSRQPPSSCWPSSAANPSAMAPSPAKAPAKSKTAGTMSTPSTPEPSTPAHQRVPSFSNSIEPRLRPSSASVMSLTPASASSESVVSAFSAFSPASPPHPSTIVAEFVPSRPKGIIRFAPFQHDIDALAQRAIEKFQVFPFGRIEKYCRHIPYASGKKDFHEKTGREGFEVFQYVFYVPGDEQEYHIMWDYNVGLVRMTPFFKCCKYNKTTPGKMLNLNPGLRDITFSITGGSIMAQGYWMPFGCARAVCATFCHNIAEALIPIFGPDFPSQCTSPESSDYGHMAISPSLVTQAKLETEQMRCQSHVRDGSSIFSASSIPTHLSHVPVSHALAYTMAERPCSPRQRPYQPTSMPRDFRITATPETDPNQLPDMSRQYYASPSPSERLPRLSEVLMSPPDLCYRSTHSQHSNQLGHQSHYQPYNQIHHHPNCTPPDYGYHFERRGGGCFGGGNLSSPDGTESRIDSPPRSALSSPIFPPMHYDQYRPYGQHGQYGQTQSPTSQPQTLQQPLQSQPPLYPEARYLPPPTSSEYSPSSPAGGDEIRLSTPTTRYAPPSCYPSPPLMQNSQVTLPSLRENLAMTGNSDTLGTYVSEHTLQSHDRQVDDIDVAHLLVSLRGPVQGESVEQDRALGGNASAEAGLVQDRLRFKEAEEETEDKEGEDGAKNLPDKCGKGKAPEFRTTAEASDGAADGRGSLRRMSLVEETQTRKKRRMVS